LDGPLLHWRCTYCTFAEPFDCQFLENIFIFFHFAQSHLCDKMLLLHYMELLPERKMLPCSLLAYADAMMTNPTPRLPFHCFFRKFSFSSILRRCCNHHEKLPALHLTTQNAPLQRPLVPQHDTIQMDANPTNAMTDRGPCTKFSSFISVGVTKKPRYNMQHHLKQMNPLY